MQHVSSLPLHQSLSGNAFSCIIDIAASATNLITLSPGTANTRAARLCNQVWRLARLNVLAHVYGGYDLYFILIFAVLELCLIQL